MSHLLFITHPEVVIDPAVPVPDWGLSAIGRARMAAFAASPRAAGIGAVWSSAERKAQESAAMLAGPRGLTPRVLEALHENNRSATGYLPPDQFWPVVADFFDNPEISVRGWERAIDAQARIVAAIRQIDAVERTPGDVAILSHGGVGALLLAALRNGPISRDLGQPVAGGGCMLTLSRASLALASGWEAIDP